MITKNKEENLWAAGFLKVIVDQWEGTGALMKSDEFRNFIKKNIEKFKSFVSSAESKKRFILTLIKLSLDRKVSSEQFKDILESFTKRNIITEADGVTFFNMYIPK